MTEQPKCVHLSNVLNSNGVKLYNRCYDIT